MQCGKNLQGRFFSARHHCRLCGFAVCSNCCKFSIEFPEWGPEKQKVCRSCATPDTPLTMAGWLTKIGDCPLPGDAAGDSLAVGNNAELPSTSDVRSTGANTGGIAAAANGGVSNGPRDGSGPNHDTPARSAAEAPSMIDINSSGAHPVPKFRRWFELRGLNLMFGSVPGNGFNGTISLHDTKLVDVATQPQAFCIVGPRLARSYVFCAESVVERQRWVEQIHKAWEEYGMLGLHAGADGSGRLASGTFSGIGGGDSTVGGVAYAAGGGASGKGDGAHASTEVGRLFCGDSDDGSPGPMLFSLPPSWMLGSDKDSGRSK